MPAQGVEGARRAQGVVAGRSAGGNCVACLRREGSLLGGDAASDRRSQEDLRADSARRPESQVEGAQAMSLSRVHDCFLATLVGLAMISSAAASNQQRVHTNEVFTFIAKAPMAKVFPL